MVKSLSFLGDIIKFPGNGLYVESILYKICRCFSPLWIIFLDFLRIGETFELNFFRRERGSIISMRMLRILTRMKMMRMMGRRMMRIKMRIMMRRRMMMMMRTEDNEEVDEEYEDENEDDDER